MRLHFYAMLAAAVFVLGTSDPRIAAGQGKPKTAKPQNNFTTQIAELRQVRALLQSANHDYKGHRAEAVKHLTHAIHHLQGPAAHAKGGKGGKKAGVKEPAVHEPQQLSNQQLQQAAAAITAIAQQLSGAKGKHASNAMPHLNNAVKEIQIALTVSPKK